MHGAVGPQAVGRANTGAQVEGLRMRNGGSHDTHDDYDEGGAFLEQVPLSEHEGKWALGLAVTCGADLLLGSSTIIIVAFKYAYRNGGVSLISLGFQALSHWMSSFLLLLRLVSELKSRNASTDQALLLSRRRRTLHREQALSVIMGLMMLISSCVILFKAFRKLKLWNKWYLDTDRALMDRELEVIAEWLAWVGFGIYSLQAVIRFVVSAKVKIGLLSHAFVISVISLVYLLVLAIGMSFEMEATWKAEPCVAIALVVLTLIEGVRIVIHYLDDMDTRLRQDNRA